MDETANESCSEQKIELEEQFILRLPQPQADTVHAALKRLKRKKFKKYLTICLDCNRKNGIRNGIVKIKKRALHAKLIDLPCIIETYKTVDKVQIYKTADVSQMLICQKEKFDWTSDDTEEITKPKRKRSKYAYPHGIAAPLKNVRKRRFHKVLKNPDNVGRIAEIEREIIMLLRADSEAVSTRFEIFYEKRSSSKVNEYTIFGEVISDSDTAQETPSSSPRTSTTELNTYML